MPVLNALFDTRFLAAYHEDGRRNELLYIAYYKKRVCDTFFGYWNL